MPKPNKPTTSHASDTLISWTRSHSGCLKIQGWNQMFVSPSPILKEKPSSRTLNVLIIAFQVEEPNNFLSRNNFPSLRYLSFSKDTHNLFSDWSVGISNILHAEIQALWIRIKLCWETNYKKTYVLLWLSSCGTIGVEGYFTFPSLCKYLETHLKLSC